MNIALVTPYFPDERTIDSGLANHYQLLAQSLAAGGNKVIVLHVRPRYEHETAHFSTESQGENITLLTYKVLVPATVNLFFKHKWAVIDLALKLRCMLVTARVLNKIIQEYHIDVVETTSYFSLCYFTLWKKLKTPVAVRVSTTFSQMMNDHYPFKSRGMNLVAQMEIAFIKKSKYLITHAASHAQELERLYDIEASRFGIIPHGINLPKLMPAQHLAPAVNVLYTGRFEYRKGTDTLLAAILLVLRQVPDTVFELAGDDPHGTYQSEFFKSNPHISPRNTVFRGRITNAELAKAYGNCDLFVAPSRYESFGIIFIEAMSYGKPVIGCYVGGVPDIITENYNGLFADTGDAQSLADKIILLIKDKGLRERMGQNARKTVEDKFTGEHLAANSLTYYQKIIVDFKS